MTFKYITPVGDIRDRISPIFVYKNIRHSQRIPTFWGYCLVQLSEHQPIHRNLHLRHTNGLSSVLA